MRTFQTKKRVPMSTIWNSLVRPCLDYCSPLWSPSPSNFREIDLLEETYRSFTRQIRGVDGLDYAQRLKKLKRSSIQRRHKCFKIIYLYKIKKGLVPNISKTNELTLYCYRLYILLMSITVFRCLAPTLLLYYINIQF